MKETVNSLRAYFIVAALLSGGKNFLTLQQPEVRGSVILALITITCLLFSATFLLIGIRMKNFLFNSTKFIKGTILINFVFVLSVWLIVLLLTNFSKAGTTVLYPSICGLLSWYLWRNTERLSKEQLSNETGKQEVRHLAHEIAAEASKIFGLSSIVWLIFILAVLFIILLYFVYFML